MSIQTAQAANIQHLPVERNLNLTEYETEYDPEYSLLWGYFNPVARPSFTLKLLSDIRSYDRLFESNGGRVLHEGTHHPVDFFVWATRMKGVYNLGGDLGYFMQCIERQDRAALLNYATLCIDNIYPRIRHYSVPNLITIALVQGDALGGGFEAVLTNDVIIAEEQAKLGLPEILFNLFPGMGAYSLLARRVGPRVAEEMMLSGNLYTAAKLHDMGIVDVLVPQGHGELAVYDYVQKVYKRRNGVAATYQARQAVFPITYEELMKVTTIWVDAALRLTDKDIRVMTRIIRSQDRLPQDAGIVRAPVGGSEHSLAG
jgi:DSF synthase